MDPLEKFIRYAWQFANKYSNLRISIPIRLSLFTTGRGIHLLASALSRAGFRIIWGEISDGSLRLGNGRIYVLINPADILAFGSLHVFRDYVLKTSRGLLSESGRKDVSEKIARNSKRKRAETKEPGQYN